MSSSINSIRLAFNCRTWKPTQEEWLFACSCVQRDELQAVNKYCFQEDSKASLIGRLLMRKAAHKLSGVPYSKIKFARTELGKPFVYNFEDIFFKLKFSFNISHHGDYCVIAAQNGGDIGVDIMKVEHRVGNKTIPEYIQLMKNSFSSSEWEFLTVPSSEELQLQKFFRLWCLKESYLKAIGTGISQSLKDVSFHCPSNLTVNNIVNDTKLTVNGSLLPQWIFEETFLDENHIVALALLKDLNSNNYLNTTLTTTFKILSFDELMDDAVEFEDISDDYWILFSHKDKKHCLC